MDRGRSAVNGEVLEMSLPAPWRPVAEVVRAGHCSGGLSVRASDAAKLRRPPQVLQNALCGYDKGM